jgi:putative secretion ATPase (PEP-CTERM system associated)
MYERFYNLRERPFALSPDPEYLYLSRVHREALDSIRYGIETRAGFIIITGEIGAGKTTLLQTILGRLDDRTIVARIVNTTLEPRELLEAILLEFGVDTTGKSKPTLLRDLGQLLVKHRAEGRRPLLVIDEAQNLSAQALEEVRLLSNLETEKSKLLQILLAGQPTLRDTIASPQLEQFRQRVAVSYHLAPLDARETAAYINSRLAHAAIGVPPRFPAEAAELVHRRSGGVPRIINVICDAALVFGYAEERREIDFSLIRDVVTELEATGVLRMGQAPAAEPAAPRAVASPAVAASAAPAAAVSPAVIKPAAATKLSAAAVAAPRETDPVPLSVDAQVAPPQVVQEAVRATALLAGREQALIQRERELAEQRRILAEECRLLRERRTAATAVRPAAPATATRPRPARPPHPAQAALRYRAPRNEGFRAWLKRILSGWSHRAMEATRSVNGS